jgi:hypothetical protein
MSDQGPIEDVRRVFRDVIENVRGDLQAVREDLREHVAVCGERQRQNEARQVEQNRAVREQIDATLALKVELHQTVVSFLWKVIAWNLALIAVLIIGWIKLAGKIGVNL